MKAAGAHVSQWPGREHRLWGRLYKGHRCLWDECHRSFLEEAVAKLSPAGWVRLGQEKKVKEKKRVRGSGREWEHEQVEEVCSMEHMESRGVSTDGGGLHKREEQEWGPVWGRGHDSPCQPCPGVYSLPGRQWGAGRALRKGGTG